MIDDTLNDIKCCNIIEAEISSFSSEDDYMRLLVDIMVEVGQYICVAACILPGDRKAWSMNYPVASYRVVHSLAVDILNHL